MLLFGKRKINFEKIPAKLKKCSYTFGKTKTKLLKICGGIGPGKAMVFLRELIGISGLVFLFMCIYPDRFLAM